MPKEKLVDTAKELLASAGITINGPHPWDIQVHDDRLYARVFSEGTLGFGEAYMDGWWDSAQLDETMARILGSGIQHRLPRNLKLLKLSLQAKWLNRQTKKRAWQVGDQHYNLGNDLFECTFDTRLTGSCAYWKDVDPSLESDEALDAAQDAKLDLICRKIGLRPGQSVFDIGCGWGAYMGFASERYGACCEGVTISREQVAYIHRRYADLPIKAHLMDYRDATGQFDHVVSMGMFEHVGPKNYRTYFETAARLLKDDGVFLLHTIGSNKSSHAIEPWMDKYIFTNGVLPSIKQVGEAVERLFVIEDVHNFGADYDKTLVAWFKKFQSNWPALKDKYGERFYRMWKYYLLASAGGFRARNIQLWQFVFSKRGVPGGYVSVR